MITIETLRLYLREFREEDATGMYLLNNDEDVIRFTEDRPFVSLEEAASLIRNYDQYSKYHCGRLTVLLKNTGEYAGWCGLKYDEDANETNLGFRFMKSLWNNGYATEAAIACIDYGFSKLKTGRITGRVLRENTASVKVLQKAGLQYWKDEMFHDRQGLVYKIENPDWR
ncbi:MAG TPA: GNAT family N-acetyltransferase [Ferruginibacter sp.]|nr:GNAT family N-acetyltransferase [Ferruginibacter sp.]